MYARTNRCYNERGLEPITFVLAYPTLSIYLPIYLSIHPSIYRSIDLSIYRSIDLSIYLYIDLSIYLYSVCMCVCVCVCVCVCARLTADCFSFMGEFGCLAEWSVYIYIRLHRTAVSWIAEGMRSCFGGFHKYWKDHKRLCGFWGRCDCWETRSCSCSFCQSRDKPGACFRLNPLHYIVWSFG